MYLIEFINEDRDIVLRQSFKNVKEFLEAVYNLEVTIAEVSVQSYSNIMYVDASANGTLITRVTRDDIYIALSMKGVLTQYEVYENLDHKRAWEKLWIKPEADKIQTYLNLTRTDRKLLPQFTAFRIKDKIISIDDHDGMLMSSKLIVLKDSPGKIYMETPSDVQFLANIEDFKPIEVFLSFSNPLISVLDYSEVPCL